MRLKFTLSIALACFCCLSSIAQNTALSFNGTNTTVSTSVYPVPTAGDFTAELWYNQASLGSGAQEFISQGSSGHGFYIGTLNNGYFRAGDDWQGTAVSIPLGQWTHIALVVTSSTTTAQLYINGALAATNTSYTVSTAGSGTPFTIGNQFSPFSEYSTATIDQVKIWNVALTATQVKQSMYGTPSTSGLILDYEMNEGSGTVLTNSGSAGATDNGTLNNSPSWVYSPIQFGNNALNFDGSSTQVVAPPNTAIDITSGTVEASIYPTTLDANNREIVGNRSVSGTRFSFHVSNAAVGIWNGSNFYTWDFAGVNAGTPYTIPTNSWTQLSWVTNGTNITLYVNGSSVGTLNAPTGTTTGLNLSIGVSPGSSTEYFQGNIDEVRVWNTQLTPGQISTYLGKSLTGSESGLVALYSFDQGNPNNANTGLLTAIDNSPTSNNATLSNFALTGTTSNFVPSSITPLPVNITTFTATKSDNTAILNWQTAQEQNSSDFTIQRSIDGTHFSAIGTVAAAGNSAIARNYSFRDASPATGLNYYRLKETDLDGKSMYSTVRTLVFSTGTAQKLVWYSTGGSTVEVNLLNGSNEFYTLNAIDGRILQKGQLNAGKLYLNGLAAGIYVVNVNSFAGQQMTAKVLIP